MDVQDDEKSAEMTEEVDKALESEAGDSQDSDRMPPEVQRENRPADSELPKAGRGLPSLVRDPLCSSAENTREADSNPRRAG